MSGRTTRLVTFLYILLRDHLPAGDVEAIIVNHVEKFPDRRPIFSNPFVEEYAREIASRLDGPLDPEPPGSPIEIEKRGGG
ncbi:MAG: hypothetical protein ACRD4R_06790 [Candidatus Acidiferrales bacterium]